MDGSPIPRPSQWPSVNVSAAGLSACRTALPAGLAVGHRLQVGDSRVIASLAAALPLRPRRTEPSARLPPLHAPRPFPSSTSSASSSQKSARNRCTAASLRSCEASASTAAPPGSAPPTATPPGIQQHDHHGAPRWSRSRVRPLRRHPPATSLHRREPEQIGEPVRPTRTPREPPHRATTTVCRANPLAGRASSDARNARPAPSQGPRVKAERSESAACLYAG